MKRGSRGVIVLLIAALLASAGVRQWAEKRRVEAAVGSGASEGQSLSGMNSFAMTLLLGGLRGPLVLMLWTSSESQKTEKNLQDFDTKVEWIRLLQPEFDSVHIFQIWNKAWNVSAQMASRANKYMTILDALDYARQVRLERGEDITLLSETGRVLAEKLGSAPQEREFYVERFRRETLTPEPAGTPRRGSSGWRRTRMDQMLDSQGQILPQYLSAARKQARPGNLPADAEWNDGRELQYLEKYQPFTYGLSPMALGYNYYKQAQVLQSTLKQRHVQDSALVVDSRPAMTLRRWAEEEWARGRKAEAVAVGMAAPSWESEQLELPTAAMPLKQAIVNPEAYREAIFSYRRAVEVFGDALAEYERHLKNFTVNIDMHRSQLDEMRAARELLSADASYLAAMEASGEQRQALLASAAEQYARARTAFQFIVLKYYVEEPVLVRMVPAGYSKANIAELPLDQVGPAWQRLSAALQATMQGYDPHGDETAEYGRYVARANQRLEQIARAGK